MKIGLIGEGAIGCYVVKQLEQHGVQLCAHLVRPSRLDESDGLRIASAADLPDDMTLMVDCAGHAGLAEHGPLILERGIDLVTLSLGALADETVHNRLEKAARDGGARLHLASGAIGALDCLQALRVGGLDEVTYVGRKPPKGWKGSAAEAVLDLDELQDAATHFSGSARKAALAYPKNANVAAAVALAGTGFDHTQVELIADPHVSANTHEIRAHGASGRFTFQVEGKTLPDNPRSSALAAMSAVAAVLRQRAAITI